MQKGFKSYGFLITILRHEVPDQDYFGPYFMASLAKKCL